MSLFVESKKIETKRQTETQLRDNGFWLGYLQGQYQDGDDVKDVLKEDERMKKVTVESSSDTWLRVHSQGKALKESGMNSRFSQRFEQGLSQIKESLGKKSGG